MNFIDLGTRRVFKAQWFSSKKKVIVYVLSVIELFIPAPL
jgi:hypothetical protein